MKFISAKDVRIFPNSPVCTAAEYTFGDKDINIALVKLSGRYPDTGWAVNESCKEVAFVVSGSGKLNTENETAELNTGDAVLIEAGEKYYWEGNMELVTPCSPAWYPEQHKQV